MSEMEELTGFEKLIDGVGQLALVIRKYYEFLLENGFNKTEALKLTIEYQREILGMSKRSQ